jgi:hypothetical protein
MRRPICESERAWLQVPAARAARLDECIELSALGLDLAVAGFRHALGTSKPRRFVVMPAESRRKPLRI